MRILHTIHSAKPETGGPIEGVLQLSRANQARGHAIEVLSLDSPQSGPASEFSVPVHRLGPGLGRYGFAPRFQQWIRGHASSFDAVIVNGLWQYNGLAVWQTLRRGPIPYFVFPHGMLDPWFRKAYPFKHLKKLCYWLLVERQLLRDARGVFFTCDEERLLARQTFPNYRCHELVATYGTAAPPEDRSAQTEAFLEKFPHLRGGRLFLFLGRIHPKKGCDLLLEGLARVLADRGTSPARDEDRIHLVIAGPDEMGWQRSLVSLASQLGLDSRITWTGMLNPDLRWGALTSAEVFVLPSHQENFGIAVVEAMACGLPVLISNKVNIWREVEADGAGWVGDDTFAGVAALLKKWLDLPAAARLEAGQRAKESFSRRFEISHVSRDFIQALEQNGVAGTPPGAEP